MKKIISIILGICLYTDIHSQVCDPKNISTFYNTSVNTERTDLRNFFNWQQNPITISTNNVIGNTTGSITNPFWDMSSLQARIDFAKDAASDFHWEDGWELIHYQTGYRQNGTFINNQQIAPMIVLYNRYKGVMKLIVNPGFSDDFINGTNVVVNILRFENNKKGNKDIPYVKGSGNLNFNESPARTLDQETLVEKISVPCKWYGKRRFAVAEFPLAYDPCVCNNHVYFNFAFKGIKSSTINLSGRFIGQSNTLIENNGDWIRNWVPTVFEEGLNKNSGVLTYNQTQAFMKHYEEKVKALERYNATNGIFKGVFEVILKEGFSSLGSTLAGPMARGLVSINMPKPFLNKLDSASYHKMIKAGVLTGGSFLTSYLGDKLFGTAPVVPTPPNVIWGEMALTGKLTDTTPSIESEFRIPAPGSLSSAERRELKNVGVTDTGVACYPLYNERLGVFNLLEKPILKYQDVNSKTPGFYKKRYMNLSNIKIAINPALDLDNVTYWASIEIETVSKPILRYTAKTENNTIWQTYSPFVPNNHTIIKTDTVGWYMPVSDLDSFKMFLNKSNPPLYTYLDTLYVKYNQDKEWIRIDSNRLGTVPRLLEDFQHQVFDYYYDNNVPFDGTFFYPDGHAKTTFKNQGIDPLYRLYPLPIRKAYLKIVGEYKFKSIGKDGNKNKTMLVNTFDIEELNDMPNMVYTDGRLRPPYSLCNYENIPNSIWLHNVTFTKDTILMAKEFVLGGEIAVANNAKVELYAVDGVTRTVNAWNNVYNDYVTRISSFVVRKSGLPPFCVQEYNMNDQDIKQYCTQGKYKANGFVNKMANSVYTPSTSKSNFLTTLTLHPNPSTSLTTLTIENPSAEQARVMVYDLVGREVYSQDMKDVSESNNKLEISTDGWNTGIYIVKVIHGEVEKSIKLEVR